MVHPTSTATPPRFTATHSVTRPDEVQAIVMDIGSTTTKSGYAGEDCPKFVVPSVSARIAPAATRALLRRAHEPERPTLTSSPSLVVAARRRHRWRGGSKRRGRDAGGWDERPVRATRRYAH